MRYERIATRWRCLLALSLLGLAGVADADWRLDYGFGQQALEKGKWQEAEALMRSARAGEPGASARKRMQGTRFAVYAPAHFAGVAAFKQGACARALDYFSDSANRAVAAQVSTLASEEQDIERSCGAHVAATDSNGNKGDGGKKAATASEAATSRAVATQPSVVDKPRTPEATPRAAVAVAAPEPKPPAVAKPLVSTPEVPVASRGAPLALRTILRAFLAGNYDAAVGTSDAGMSDARGHALVLLVRAAAWSTHAELAGGDAGMLLRAQQDIRASRRLAAIDPDPTLFSPKVRALIARTR